MSMAGSKSDGGTGEMPDPTGRASRRWLRRLGWSTIVAGVAAAALLTLGFVWFLSSVPDDEVALTHNADGIVVLTGGASRVTDAIELMAAGRGQRLLISGLHRTTTVGEIQRLNPDFTRVIRCCVDFDHSRNTLGNAIETKRWAEDRRISVDHRGDVELSHAACACRDRAPAARRRARAVSGGHRANSVPNPGGGRSQPRD